MIPTTLDEALDYLDAHTSAGDKAEFLSHSDAHYHFSTGMGLRNQWKLWEPTSPLAKFFAANGIHHADDSSACIFKAFRARLQNKPFDLAAEAAYYKVYWEKSAKLSEHLDKGIKTFKVSKDGSVTPWEAT